MSAHHGGKGDTPIPVDPKKYGENYDAIFRKMPKNFVRRLIPPKMAAEILENRNSKDKMP